MEHFDLQIPPGLDPELATLVAAWTDGTREWLAEAGEISDQAVIQPCGANNISIGALMLHIIDCDEGWFSSMFGVKLAQPSPASELGRAVDVDGRKFPTPPAWPFAKYVEIMQETRAELVAGLAGIRADQTFTSQRGNVFTARWVIAHLVQHDSYHGGQIVLLNEEFCAR